MVHIRQSRQHSGLGFQVKVIKSLEVIPSSHGLLSEGREPRDAPPAQGAPPTAVEQTQHT